MSEADVRRFERAVQEHPAGSEADRGCGGDGGTVGGARAIFRLAAGLPPTFGGRGCDPRASAAEIEEAAAFHIVNHPGAEVGNER